MKIDLSQFRQTFLQESADHVASMEERLLELRSAPSDVELLNSIFRSAHSIKGGAGSFGFTNLTKFTHSLENLLERLRSLEIQADDKVIDVLLHSVDVLRGLLSAGQDVALSADGIEMIAHIETLMASESGPEEVSAPIHSEHELPQTLEDGQEIKLYKVDLRPDREMFASGTNPIVLLRNLAALGTVSCCHLHLEELPALADLDPSQCYLSWTMELASIHAEAELREVFEFVEHLADIRISCSDAQQHPDETLESSSEAQVNSAPVRVSDGQHPIAEGRAAKAADRSQPAAKTAASGESSSIRVAIDKVDRLIDLVGELVIAHVMTAQMVENFEPACLPKLREAVASMERNTRELHERVMGIRMLPVGTLFRRYSRIVYDIAQATGKQIRLELHGEESEIDKACWKCSATR
jgi:two-component system, chemotaxis family, sensor kinase CheA